MCATHSAVACSHIHTPFLLPPHKQGNSELVDFQWPDDSPALPPLRPHLWDPRYLASQHLVVAAHAVSLEQTQKHGSAAADLNSSAIVGQVCIPLRPACEAAAAAAKATNKASAASGAGAGGGGGTGAGGGAGAGAGAAPETGSEEEEEGGGSSGEVPAALRAAPVPFSLEMLFAGQPIGYVQGLLAFRSVLDPTVETNPDDVIDFAAAASGNVWEFEDSDDAASSGGEEEVVTTGAVTAAGGDGDGAAAAANNSTTAPAAATATTAPAAGGAGGGAGAGVAAPLAVSTAAVTVKAPVDSPRPPPTWTPPPPVREGYMYTRGDHGKTWAKRYLVLLGDGRIDYFRSKSIRRRTLAEVGGCGRVWWCSVDKVVTD